MSEKWDLDMEAAHVAGMAQWPKDFGFDDYREALKAAYRAGLERARELLKGELESRVTELEDAEVQLAAARDRIGELEQFIRAQQAEHGHVDACVVCAAGRALTPTEDSGRDRALVEAQR